MAMERGIKSQLFAAIALLACVGAMGLGVEGCHKQQPKEEEKVFAVKRFPRLNPKGSVLGRWELGFIDVNDGIGGTIKIPTEKSGWIRFSLHADSSWEWQGAGREKLEGSKFTTVHVVHNNGYSHVPEYDSLSFINNDNEASIIFIYALDDTCMVEAEDMATTCGSSAYIYYLRERE